MNDPLRHISSRGGLRGRRRWPCSTSRSVCQATTPSSLKDQVGASFVVNAQLHPMGVAEIEFVQIPLQMGFRDVLENAIDASLEDREVSLNGVGID